MKDNVAWNETEPGKGGTPARRGLNERALMLWTLPAGAIKAANDAGAARRSPPRTARRSSAIRSRRSKQT